MARIALVTGGIRGIGEAVSLCLKDKGCTVVATYAGADDAAEAFKKKTGLPVYKWDVGDYDACQKGVAQVEKEIGPIDILVNNAGITRDAMMHKMEQAAWEEVLRVNLFSVYNMSRAVINGMRERKFGRIINVSSINGQAGQLGQTNYAAAKAGMIGFTKSLALENASRGITVNAIAPGYIDTDMVRAVPPEVLQKIVAKIPTGRLGKPEEIGHAVCFLASDDAAFMTGATLTMNGGQYMV